MWSAKQWACQRTADELDSRRKQRKNWMRVSLSANLLSWLTRAMHSWSSWLPTLSPVVSRKDTIQEVSHHGCWRTFDILFTFKMNVTFTVQVNIFGNLKPTIFVFLLVLLFALFTGRFALWGLRCSRLASATRAASWKGWRGGAGQHLAATKGTGEQLQ